MSKGSEESEEELERKSIFTSAKNRVSKIGTGIKSAAEYGLVEGVGKTIKNFASGVSSGAKQGYGYFTTDRNMHSAMMDAFNKLENLAPISDESAKNHYKTLGDKDKFSTLLSECNNVDKISGLEEIVKNQIKDLSVLTLDNKYNKLLTEPKYTELAPEEKLKKLIDISSDIFNKMHDERAKQPDFIATTRKIERLKNQLETQELPNLAGAAGISNSEAYKNAQTYEEKIDLIRIKLEADKKKLASSPTAENLKNDVQNFTKKIDPNTVSSDDIITKMQNAQKLEAQIIAQQHEKVAIETALGELKTAQKALAELRAAEKQLLEPILNPKQNRVVRTLKTAAGLMAGATIGALRGSGSAIKTAAGAVKKAPSGIKTTYQQNRNKQQNTR